VWAAHGTIGKNDAYTEKFLNVIYRMMTLYANLFSNIKQSIHWEQLVYSSLQRKFVFSTE